MIRTGLTICVLFALISHPAGASEPLTNAETDQAISSVDLESMGISALNTADNCARDVQGKGFGVAYGWSSPPGFFSFYFVPGTSGFGFTFSSN